MKSIVLALCLLITPFASADVPAINKVLDQFHIDASKADFKSYFSHFSARGIFIGTDATERWSVTEFKAFVKPFFSKGRGWTYMPRNRHIDMEGDIAWFDEMLDSKAYGECRGSGVMIKENGRWKIAQYNLHFPVPNDLAKGITQQIKKASKK